jgi:cytochrome c553
MRRFFKVFLIALLALRALVGDAMAYDMAQAMSHAPVAVAAQHAEPMVSSMPCHTVDSDDAAQPACTTCQVCHMSAFLPVSLLPLAQALPSELPATQVAAWFSFDNALVSKPPIL